MPSHPLVVVPDKRRNEKFCGKTSSLGAGPPHVGFVDGRKRPLKGTYRYHIRPGGEKMADKGRNRYSLSQRHAVILEMRTNLRQEDENNMGVLHVVLIRLIFLGVTTRGYSNTDSL